jgi:hypothetical protein
LRPFVTTLFLCALILTKPNVGLAGDFVEDPTAGGTPSTSESGGDSTFDPFSDYSEFEEGSEEEADINFFHNGRFFSIGVIGGYETFTDNLGVLYSPGVQFGGFIEYFFDLKLAMQLAYITASHGLTIDSGTTSPITGNVSLSHFEFDLKYYLNTQNVTRGLAALNPYIIFGASTYSRQTTISSSFCPVGGCAPVNDSAFGAQGGLGIEIPMFHNSSFFGLQGTYNYIALPQTPVTLPNGSQGLTFTGTASSIVGMLGMSF